MSRKLTTALVALLLGVVQPGTAALRAQGPQEGIKVHGHWTIDVRDPDGTLVQHHEFENSLATYGATTLAQTLGRVSSAGHWEVWLWNNLGVNAPCSGYCQIDEPDAGVPTDSWHFNTLNVVVTGSTIVLNGTATAFWDGQINWVGTLMQACPTDVVVAKCTSLIFNWVTQANPATTFVNAGQVIQVQVVISFS